MDPNEPPLPDWFEEFRPHQLDAVRDVMDAFSDGARVVVMEAPTGSGKTLIAEQVRREMGADRTLYTTPVKHLQHQFARDYPYAKVLMGRSNYPTLQDGLFGPPLHVSAADCDRKDNACSYCGSAVGECPYEVAKQDALHARLSVINTAYLLTEANGPGRFSGIPFVIVDEADVLESELMRYVSLEISERYVKKYGLGVPAQVTKPDAWVEWSEAAFGKLTEYRSKEKDPIRRAREVKRIQGYRQKLMSLARGIEAGGWVYTGRDGEVSFKPVTVADQGNQVLWRHGFRWLLMSATIVSAKTLLEDELGYAGAWRSVEVASTFPTENRPVVVRAVADMGRKGKEAGQWGRAFEEIDRIVHAHPDERVLVHTVSYALAKEIVDYLQEADSLRAFYTYTTARDRDTAMRYYLADPNGVLVASSMDRGVDLPDDACRVVIVAKIPYAYLGDRQVSARLYGTRGGKQWYAVNTVRVLIQMSGRGVRHDEDRCVTYIIDAGFRKLWGENRGLFPEYWREAMRWENAE